MSVLFQIENLDFSYLKNGALIDTSVLYEVMQGIVCTRRNSTDTGWREEYEKLIALFERMKIYADWSQFVLTPHILTETSSHINVKYNRDADFPETVANLFYIAEKAQERNVEAKSFMYCYSKGARLEPGDLSIYSVADSFETAKEKITIISKDDGFISRYTGSKYVMVVDYRLITL